MGLMVADFGTKDGVSKYRVNGTKEQIEQYIDYLKGQECELVSDPEIVTVRPSAVSEWTCLFEFKKLEISASTKTNDATK